MYDTVDYGNVRVCVRTRVRTCVCVSVAIWLRTYGFFSGLGAAMLSGGHAIQRWTALIRTLLGLKAPTRRGGRRRKEKNIRQRIRDEVDAFVKKKEESGGAVEED